MVKLRAIHFFCGLVLATTMAFITGCGTGSDGPELGTVIGTVKLDGQPLTNALVTFEPEAGGRASMGRTNAGGDFELTFDENTKGAIVGRHRVSISAAASTATVENPDPSAETKDPVPAKYNTESTLVEEVKAGSNAIDFDLTSS